MKFRAILYLLLGIATILSVTGCTGAGPRKYLLFGDPQPEKVEMFEDYWSDYFFKPDDPDLLLRRGKGGVIRFFKKNNYTRSILVDGDLTVNVYHSVKEGVTLTQPDAQMVVTSKELNEKHRKFDKETGYSYHVFLDLGEYDQPEAEITILSVFKDAKTGQTTLSKEIRTTAAGTTPLEPERFESERSEAERWARSVVGDDVENPIAELQARYSARRRQKEEAQEALGATRERETIDLDAVQSQRFAADGATRSASYLEEAEARREATRLRVLEENREKADYYRDDRRRRVLEYEEEQKARSDDVAPLRDSRSFTNSSNFSDANRARDSFQEIQSSQFEKFSNVITDAAREEYKRRDDARELELRRYESQRADELSYPQSPERSRASQVSSTTTPQTSPRRELDKRATPSEFDRLDDFLPEADSPNTEVYVRRN